MSYEPPPPVDPMSDDKIEIEETPFSQALPFVALLAIVAAGLIILASVDGKRAKELPSPDISCVQKIVPPTNPPLCLCADGLARKCN
jgi:hypothetical protein